MPPIPGIRLVKPSPKDWWTPKLNLTQNLFVSAELVQIRNTWGGAEYYCKYEVLLTDGRRYIIPNRVSDISGVKWDIEKLQQWMWRQGASRLVGDPVLRGVTYGGEVVEIRGDWEKIDAAINPPAKTPQHQKLKESKIDLDQSNALLTAWEEFAPLELLQHHKQAFVERYQSRDEAAELGTRAHDLIEKWCKFPDLQEVDEDTGLALVDVIHYKDRDGEHWVIELAKEDPRVQSCVRAFHEFWLKRGLKIVAAEMLVVDLAGGVAGMIDNVSTDSQAELGIVDYKTGNYISQSMLLQVTGYAYMYWLCTGRHIAWAYILQLDKKTMTFQEVPVFTNQAEREENMVAWLKALDLYLWQKQAGKKLTKARKDNKEDAA